MFEQNSAPKYSCTICDYFTSKTSSYKSHLLSAKHKKSMFVNDEQHNFNPKPVKIDSKQYTCKNCNKEYKDNSGLWRHKQKCQNEINKTNKNNISVTDNCNIDMNNGIINPENNQPLNLGDITDKQLIIQLLTQNQELQKTIIELTKNAVTTNSNNTINSNNKTFNLQVFLNEKCKNAMNISDFVNSIHPTLKDLENVGRVGYVEGISQIIINKLNDTEVTERPIHCSDLKREIMFIKNDNVWSKEGDDKPILLKAIKEVANKNIQNIMEWTKANPGCTKSDSRKNDLYLDIVSNSMCGSDKEETNKNFNKIISKLSKKVSLTEYK